MAKRHGLTRARSGNLAMPRAGGWKVRASVTPEQRARLARLDARLPDAIEMGQVAPALLWLLKKDEGTFLVPKDSLTPSQARIENHVENFVGELRPLKTLCDRFGAKLVVLLYPIPKFCSREINENYQKLGFVFVPGQLTTEIPDTIARTACAALGVPCVLVTDAFRKTGQHTSLFYPLDGHLNPAGNELLGQLLAPRALDWIVEEP